MRWYVDKNCLWSIKVLILACFFFHVCFLASPTHGDNDEKVASFTCDLKSCIEAALSRHPDIRVAEMGRLAAESRVRLEEAGWRPQLSLEGESGYLGGRPVSPYAVARDVTEEWIRVQEVSRWYYTGSVIFNAPIVKDGGIIGYDTPKIQQARLDVAVKENLKQVSRDHVIFDVKKAYINLVKSLRIFESQQQIVKIIEANYNTVLAKFNQNLISRNDLLIAGVQLATARRDMTVLKNSIEQARRELAMAIGLPATTKVEITGVEQLSLTTKPLPSFEELISLAYQQRFDIRAQQTRIEIKEEDVRQVRNERFPSLGFMARYNFGDDFDPPINHEWRALVHLAVPIFDFGITKAKVSVAKTEVTEEIKKMESVKASIASEVNGVYAVITQIANELNLIGKQIEQAKEALKLSRAKFEQQLLPQSAVAEAEVAIIKLEQAKTQASYDLMIAYSQLEFVTGGWENKSLR